MMDITSSSGNDSFSISDNDYQLMMNAPLEAPQLRRVVSDDSITVTPNDNNKRPHPELARRVSDSSVQPLAKRRRVRFQSKPQQVVEGQPLPPKQQCWYSKEDLVSSRKLARRLSRQVDSDSILMETFDRACAQQHPSNAVERLEKSRAFWKQRGLERLSKGHAISRNIQVCSVKSAVLLEQSCQYLEGKKDPERLAQASLMASGPSQHFAHMLAMADQSMANRIHSETSAVPASPVAPTA